MALWRGQMSLQCWTEIRGISGLYLGHWPVFVPSGVMSLGISCTPTHCSLHISSGGLGICLSRCSSLSHHLPVIDQGEVKQSAVWLCN